MGSSAPLRPEGTPAGMPYLSLAAATIYNIAKVTRRRRGRQFGAFRPVTRLRHYSRPAAAPAERYDWCTRCIFAFYSYIKCNCLVARRSRLPQWSSSAPLHPTTTSSAAPSYTHHHPQAETGRRRVPLPIYIPASGTIVVDLQRDLSIPEPMYTLYNIIIAGRGLCAYRVTRDRVTI